MVSFTSLNFCLFLELFPFFIFTIFFYFKAASQPIMKTRPIFSSKVLVSPEDTAQVSLNLGYLIPLLHSRQVELISHGSC